MQRLVACLTAMSVVNGVSRTTIRLSHTNRHERFPAFPVERMRFLATSSTGGLGARGEGRAPVTGSPGLGCVLRVDFVLTSFVVYVVRVVEVEINECMRRIDDLNK
jgi:hypothetical protein